MDWSGTEQLYHFLQCVIMGSVLGIQFELTCALIRVIKSPILRFIIDALYGVIASVITFFWSLIITDGRMHPVLFVGGLCGFLCEHYALGRFISRGMAWVLKKTGQGIGKTIHHMDTWLSSCCRSVRKRVKGGSDLEK